MITIIKIYYGSYEKNIHYDKIYRSKKLSMITTTTKAKCVEEYINIMDGIYCNEVLKL